MTPSEAYMTKKVPVIPPAMRLIRELPDGTKAVPDINYLYQDLTTLALKSYPDAKEFGTEGTQKEIMADIYDAVGAIAGLNEPVNQNIKDTRGFLKQLTGSPSKVQERKGITRGPKFSYLQKKVLRKGQDLSTGGVIIGDPTLDVDELGILKCPL